MGYPAAPWQMQGQLWLSLFRVRGVEGRPDGVYGAAFVSYEPGSELTYSEVQDMGGVKYAYLSDPDGNSWALQQISRGPAGG